MAEIEYKRLIPLGELLDRARPSFRSLPDEDRQAVIREVLFEPSERGAFLWRFGVLMVLSTALAALGLIADSVAVVIGAMLVAPLMTPMLGVAASLVLADAGHLIRSLITLVGGTLLAIGTGYVVAVVAPGGQSADQLSAEILSRVDPNLLDLFVAIVAGLAGGYVLTHPRASSSLPGVAIAVALVPPLATVGITLALDSRTEAWGAFLLYLTNFVAIVLSALIVLVTTGFTPEHVRRSRTSKARLGILITSVFLVVLAVPLGVHTFDVIRDQQFTTRVLGAVQEWDPNAVIVELNADIGEDRATVDLVVATAQNPAGAWELAQVLSEETGKVVDVELRVRVEDRDSATSG